MTHFPILVTIPKARKTVQRDTLSTWLNVRIITNSYGLSDVIVSYKMVVYMYCEKT